VLYGDEMVGTFALRLAACRRTRAVARFLFGQFVRVMGDAADARLNAMFSSHPSSRVAECESSALRGGRQRFFRIFTAAI
jgi:hypothetical protein